MTIVSPYESSEDWDALTICVRRAGKTNFYTWEQLPVDFDGDVVNDYDIKKAKSSDGARVGDLGYTPTQFGVIWLLHRPDHFQTYVAFIEDARPRPGKEPKPTIGIVHPMLQLFVFQDLKIEKFRFPEPKAVDQWEAKIEVVEDMPAPKPVKKETKTGSITLPEITVVGRTMTSFRRDRPAGNGTTYIAPPPLPSSNVRPST